MFDEFAEFDRWDSTRILAFMLRSSQATLLCYSFFQERDDLSLLGQ